MTTEELRQSLLLQPQNGYSRISPAQREQVEQYAKRYTAFISACKTERESVCWAVREAERRGFRPVEPGMTLSPGDKVYLNNRSKSLILAVIGAKPMNGGVNICGAHIDSPRIDLKPNPLYEDNEIAYFKTHYYGGIKKYQWACIPLALHGIVCRKDGTAVNIVVGEEDTDPVLVISDLLIHLSADQLQKPLAKGIEGDQLNILLGTEPLEGTGSELVKLNIMKLLNEKYGITEADFHSAELTIVPAGRGREVGLDRSMIGAYGHDDRVCAYAQLEAIFSLENPDRTAVCVLADKEEIGSVGISSMESKAFEYFMEILCQSQGANLLHCFTNSFCLSADVAIGFDPTFPEVCDPRNSARLNHGVGVCKYTGTKGKSFASDASAEVMHKIRTILDNAGVIWQMSTLGKVDVGGGGTIAYVMANRNIPTVDAGVPVLCMHAPFELVSKLDAYMAMEACRAVYNS